MVLGWRVSCLFPIVAELYLLSVREDHGSKAVSALDSGIYIFYFYLSPRRRKIFARELRGKELLPLAKALSVLLCVLKKSRELSFLLDVLMVLIITCIPVPWRVGGWLSCHQYFSWAPDGGPCKGLERSGLHLCLGAPLILNQLCPILLDRTFGWWKCSISALSSTVAPHF